MRGVTFFLIGSIKAGLQKLTSTAEHWPPKSGSSEDFGGRISRFERICLRRMPQVTEEDLQRDRERG